MVSMDEYTPGDGAEAKAKLMKAVFDEIIRLQCELGLEVSKSIVMALSADTLIEQKVKSHFCEVYAIVCDGNLENTGENNGIVSFINKWKLESHLAIGRTDKCEPVLQRTYGCM